MKRRLLIGLSRPNFTIWTTKIDHSQINFSELRFQNTAQQKQFVLKKSSSLHIWQI